MAKKLPWFPFYPTDFAEDIHVVAMTTEQVGAYILLLCRSWQCDPPGTLPDDDDVLARFARVDRPTWDRIKGGVLRAFVKQCSSTGQASCLQKRLSAEYEKAKRQTDNIRSRARKAALARWDKHHNRSSGIAPGTAPAMPGQCLTNADFTVQSIRDTSGISSAGKPPAKGNGPKKEPKPREPDPLFDAVAEVTGSDPKTAASHVAKVRHALAAADPPYTPDEVREFGRRFLELCSWARGERQRPELGELQKHIGKLRAARPAKPDDPREQQRRQFLTQVRLGNMTLPEAEFSFGGPLDDDPAP